MGKRRAWISAVKKAISCEPKENKENKNRKWFGKQRSKDLNSPSVENAVVIASVHPHKEEVKLIEAAENEQNRHAYSVALVTAMAAEAAVAAAHAAAEVVRLRAVASSSGRTKEEVAVVKIQTAFRGYMARRTLRVLRGLMRLKSLIGGQSMHRQSAATWKRMQTVARVQSDIRARRIRILSEENKSSAIQRQKREKEIATSGVFDGESWDDSMQSREQIEANIRNRQEAAMRRERALAYAYSNQLSMYCKVQTNLEQTWRNSSNQTFMDPSNPHWGWSWLARWMSARPWEENDDNTVDQECKTTKAQSLNAQRQSQRTYSPSTSKSSKLRRPSQSLRGPIGTDDDSKSVNSTQSGCCRRHSIAGSSVRDDDSLASSSAVPSYMASTESARAKSRFPSPLRTPDRASVSSKKCLSFSGSPGGPRRQSEPSKSEL